jgi:hypothetical protein
LQAEVKFLREKLQRREAIHTEEARRKDTIITTMAQRISKLEAALEPRESPMSEPPGTVGEGSPAAAETSEKEAQRPWWHRLFGA